jgi:hypothetical protein
MRAGVRFLFLIAGVILFLPDILIGAAVVLVCVVLSPLRGRAT